MANKRRGQNIAVLLMLVSISVLCVFQHCYSALKDPTMPPGYQGGWLNKDVETNGFIVSSILYSDHRKVAVVNNYAVKEGDTLKGATIVAIEPDAVRFKDSKGEFTAPLYSRDIKQEISTQEAAR